MVSEGFDMHGLAEKAKQFLEDVKKLQICISLIENL